MCAAILCNICVSCETCHMMSVKLIQKHLTGTTMGTVCFLAFVKHKEDGEDWFWGHNSLQDVIKSKFLVRNIKIMKASQAWRGYQLTKTVQNGGPQAISEILHIEYRMVCCIKAYLIPIYHMSKCSKCNWNRYIEGFCMWNVYFHINVLSPNITYVILMSWLLMVIYFLLLNYWLFSVQFSYHI